MQKSVRSMLENTVVRNSQLPASDALPFYINGRHCGTLTKRSQDYLLRDEFIEDFVFSKKRVELRQCADVTARLADLAKRLHDCGAFFQWRDELLDVVCIETGEVIAKAERGLFRFLGLTTHCVYAVGINNQDQIYMSLRSKTKQIDPGLWDTLAAGLMSSGETPKEALAREIYEEAGLVEADYTCGEFSTILVTRPVREGWMREIGHCALVSVKSEMKPHNIDGEVEEIELVEAKHVILRIRDRMVPAETSVAFMTVLCANNIITGDAL